MGMASCTVALGTAAGSDARNRGARSLLKAPPEFAVRMVEFRVAAIPVAVTRVLEVAATAFVLRIIGCASANEFYV